MSATYIEKKIRIKAFGRYTTIPNNAIAKLMYYLHCVTSVVDIIIDPVLTDYQNYDELTWEQLKEVHNTATKYSPDIFQSHKIFIVDRDLLNNSSNNEFYEITDETIGIHVDKEIIIGGRVTKVNKIMVCNNSWLSENYFSPISEIDKFFERIENGNYLKQILNTQTYLYEERPPIIIPTEFDSKPVVMTCTNCKVTITTKTESKLNCLAICCCLLFDLFYFIFQAIRKRNLCCCDIEHRCPRCGAFLGVYKSC